MRPPSHIFLQVKKVNWSDDLCSCIRSGFSIKNLAFEQIIGHRCQIHFNFLLFIDYNLYKIHPLKESLKVFFTLGFNIDLKNSTFKRTKVFTQEFLKSFQQETTFIIF